MRTSEVVQVVHKSSGRRDRLGGGIREVWGRRPADRPSLPHGGGSRPVVLGLRPGRLRAHGGWREISGLPAARGRGRPGPRRRTGRVGANDLGPCVSGPVPGEVVHPELASEAAMRPTQRPWPFRPSIWLARPLVGSGSAQAVPGLRCLGVDHTEATAAALVGAERRPGPGVVRGRGTRWQFFPADKNRSPTGPWPRDFETALPPVVF